MSRIIATFFGVGLLPWAPGTWGSAAAIPVAWVIHGLGGFHTLLLATIAVTLIGWWATAAATRGKDDHDPGGRPDKERRAAVLHGIDRDDQREHRVDRQQELRQDQLNIGRDHLVSPQFSANMVAE